MTRYVEHQHQVSLITWAHMTRLPTASDVEDGSTIGDYIFAVPMGGKRNPIEAKRLKAEGAKAGVSDLILPLRRCGFAGLFLEMKAPGEKPTEKQSAWLQRMARAGYRAEWVDSWIKAAAIIADYCGVRPPLANLVKGP